MGHKNSKKAYITVWGSLCEFLPEKTGQKSDLTVSFELNPSVKDILERLGIPHTAIFSLLVNGRQRDSNYNVNDSDEIEAYPFESVDKDHLKPIYSAPSSFIADIHLQKLGRYLRLLGLDTVIPVKSDNESVIKLSNQENRMILTRNLELLKNGSAKYGYWVRATDPDLQLEEVLERFSVEDKFSPFSRCMKCNGKLKIVSKEEVTGEIPPKVREWCDDFRECGRCGQVYWKGSHYRKLKEKLEQII